MASNGITYSKGRLPSTKSPASSTSSLWDTTYQAAIMKYPPEYQSWLQYDDFGMPFTSTQIFKQIEPLQQKYQALPFQRFITWLGPTLSHINSFAKVIGMFAQINPAIGCLIWGSIHLVVLVAARANQHFEQVLQLLGSLSPELAIFQRWLQLFPEKSHETLAGCMCDVYSEIIGFCVETVRFLRRKPTMNLFYLILRSDLEGNFAARQKAIRLKTKEVKREVEYAHMESVRNNFNTIQTMLHNLTPSPGSDFTKNDRIRVIPHAVNDRFFGREKILQEMHQYLSPVQPKKRQRCLALYGLGGAGKTQVALEYTYRFMDHYPIIIWILADNPEKIDREFLNAATHLGLERSQQNANQAKSFVLQKLATTETEFLLVFDNADDLSLVQDCLPHSNHGSVIFTSRDSVKSVELTANSLQIPEFSIDEGCLFLQSLLPTKITKENFHQTLKIATIFDGLPLALSQVAGFIRTFGCSLSEFLDIHEDQRYRTTFRGHQVKDYHANLATVWDLSVATLDQNSRTLLELLVYLDPDSIPCQLFKRSNEAADNGTSPLAFMTNPIAVANSLTRLRTQSFIRMNTNLQTISIHRLVQKNAREQLCSDREKQRSAFNNTLLLLQEVQKEFKAHHHHWSVQHWDTTEIYLPHILCLRARYHDNPEIFEDSRVGLVRLLHQCSIYLFERNRYRACYRILEDARAILRSSPKFDVLLMSDLYRCEGRVCNEDCQAEQAIIAFQFAYKYGEEAAANGTLDVHDGRMARILTGWGNALSHLRQFEEALKLQMKALELCTAVPQATSDAVFIVRLNWGFLLYRKGDLVEAKRILRAALNDDPKAAWTMVALGSTYLRENKQEKALNLFLEAMRLYLNMFGDWHQVSGAITYKVGEILTRKGEWNQARELVAKSLEIFKSQEQYYDIRGAYARNLRMMAIILEHFGELKEAQEKYEEAWKLREELTGVKGSIEDSDADYADLVFYWNQ